MDDEIDIEEHDVLDNPIIKSIFPDITALKKEITYYFEDESIRDLETDEIPYKEHSLEISISDDDTDVALSCTQKEEDKLKQSNKIILGSKPIATTQDNNKLDSKANVSGKLLFGSKSDLDLIGENRNLPNDEYLTHDDNRGKLFLGSKPTPTQDGSSRQPLKKVTNKKKHQGMCKTKHVKVLLQDIKSYLNQNGRYCKKCCRLFLSKHALQAHRTKMHPSEINKKKYTNNKINIKKTHMCLGGCGAYFSRRSNMIRHCKSRHAEKYKIYLKSKTQLCHKCSFCNIRFKSAYTLNIHNICKHQTKSNENEDHKPSSNSKENHNAKHDTIQSANKKRKLTLTKALKTNAAAKVTQNNTNAPEKCKFASPNKNDHPSINAIDSTVSDTRKHLIVKTEHPKKDLAAVAIENESAENQKPNYKTRANSAQKDKNVCLHCNELFTDQKSLIDHMYQILEPNRNASGSTENDESEKKVQDDKILFTCRHCSYYLSGISGYFTHMIKNHKTEKFININKEVFDPQCKYCSYKCSSIATHNNHVHRYHTNLMFLKLENEIEHEKQVQLRKSCDNFYEEAFSEYREFALESVIFECNKCSVCFLSSDVAKDHELHKELLINWKCSICLLILKEQDKVMHLKQHSFCESLKLFTLNETAKCNVLYICTKCAIHFTENRYQKHYPICGSEIADSYRCNKCEILIDKTEKNHHEIQHELLGNTLDFTLIDSNVIIADEAASPKSVTTITGLRPIKRTVERNCLTYCPTCKTFHKDLGLKNKSHINGTCSKALKYVCHECGLVFTYSVLSIHKEHHENVKTLSLQDYKFFDLKGKQVLPPIPEYLNCKKCGIHFLKKIAVSGHSCGETDFLTCDICNMKLTETAYKLHMPFHYYVIREAFHESETTPHETKEHIKNTSQKSYKEQERNVPKITAEHKNVDDYEETKTTAANKITNAEAEHITENTDDNSLVVLYTCKTCSISVESYDEVIKHCQTHYSNEANQKMLNETSLKKCKQCLLNFESQYYICHQQRVHCGVSKIHIITFDPSYFTSKNTTWIKHLFQALSENVVNKLLEKSIFQHEHRIQLECLQRGSSNVYVYQCDMCKNFIDPANVYKHAQRPCNSIRKHVCSFCSLPFNSWMVRSSHEKLHKQDQSLTKKSLNIILFNQNKDKFHNGRIFCTANQYVFYQCRNCAGVTEKSKPTTHTCDTSALIKCKSCGLLITKEHHKAHLSKHTDLRNFSSENYKVVLFGSCKNPKAKLLSSFSGIVYDYSIYKCRSCQMCLRNTEYAENHICSETYDLDRAMCTACDLYFPTSYLKLHAKQHQSDPDFKIENINVCEFNDSKIEQKYNIKDGTNTNNTIINIDDESDVSDELTHDNQTNKSIIDERTLYKCKCGLHFVNKQKVIEHIKKCLQKQYKQNCSKCNLLFNASELFSHLVAHHKDKNEMPNFKVIEM